MKDRKTTITAIENKKKLGFELTAKEKALSKLYGYGDKNEQIRTITPIKRKSRYSI